ncbi:MaoC family dehydratase [Mesorhizobium sp. M1409]|uniref:MaoC family dehydratase n=1 Tax=unclassified Mesorhizobium TaxID=325217 RepID=UPI003335A15B
MSETEAVSRDRRTIYNRWSGRKAATFENINIPDEVGPIEIEVNTSIVKQYAFCEDDYRSWHFGTSPFGAPIGHAALLANDLYTVYYAQYDRTTLDGLHTSEELFFHAPVPVGETVTITGRFVDKYVRRGNGYLILEAEARDRQGNLLVSHRSSEIMRVAPGLIIGRSSAPPPDDKVVAETNGARPVDKAVPAIAPGTPILSKVKTLSQAQISVYAFVGEHDRNLHNDIEIARKSGLDNTIAQGLQSAGYFSEVCTDFFGASWFTSGRLKAKFVAPVYCDSTLIVSGKVASQVAEEGAIRTHLEMWAKDQDGRLVSIGWASALHNL